jgi:hypothetical protein
VTEHGFWAVFKFKKIIQNQVLNFSLEHMKMRMEGDLAERSGLPIGRRAGTTSLLIGCHTRHMTV